jgi:acetyl-CoA C-acetyltransferase
MGRFQGALSSLAAPRLGAIAVKAAVERAGIDPKDVEEVLMGNVVQAGLGQAPARQAAIFGGMPASVSATTVNKVCGSGLKAAMWAAQAIRAGDADLFVAGGFESMSRAPYLVNGRLGELKFGNAQLTDALLIDGLWDPFENWGMGMAAEFIADEYEVTREAMDQFSFESQQKAVAAQEAGKFNAEMVPVEIAGRKGEVTVDRDEGPRKDSTAGVAGEARPLSRRMGK